VTKIKAKTGKYIGNTCHASLHVSTSFNMFVIATL